MNTFSGHPSTDNHVRLYTGRIYNIKKTKTQSTQSHYAQSSAERVDY